MAVVASFTAVPQTGLIPPSEAVVFTDTSTGSPDSWLWDFGDGEMSSSQNPSHTFTGSIGQTFTVTLTAWISAGETNTSPSVTTTQSRTGSDPVAATAYANMLALSYGVEYGLNNATTRVQKNTGGGGTFIYQQARSTYSSISIPSAPTGAGPSLFLIRVSNGTPFTILSYEGTYTSDLGGNHIASSDTSSKFPFIDVTAFMGQVLSALFSPVDTMLTPPVVANNFSYNGSSLGVHLTEFKTSSADDTDTASKEVSFGTSPVADFTAAPTIGANPLSVQFTNTTVEAVGLPTTYSWKKRISGSGDAFVEFSTSENPLASFTKV